MLFYILSIRIFPFVCCYVLKFVIALSGFCFALSANEQLAPAVLMV